ncbi:MT-A70 family methyltransferase [Actinomycetospora sp.]|uniref:MT-A70 family methyltransferase n=1 Tax=Actinomycetospora sp. TaxID=1872135 RepID=UPI002F404918
MTAAAAADPSAADPGPAQPEPGRGVAARRTRRPARVDPLRVDVSPLEATPLPRTGGGWSCVYADPPWRFTNRTGKVAPEHRRLDRYDTMTAAEIAALPVADVAADNAHLYLWVPNALLPEGLAVMQGWGFRYVSNLVWAKRRKDGGPDGRGVGFYFRNVTELILFGVRGSMRTLDPARRQVNMIETVKREHSRKPDEAYDLIEACSPGPYLEMFARYPREGWSAWGAESETDVTPRGKQYPTYGGGAPHEPGTHSHSDAGESDHAASFGREI